MTTEQAADKCAVCLEALEPTLPDYTRMKLSSCYHTFHTACIAQWLIQSHTCPQCRRVVKERRRELITASPAYDMGVYGTLDVCASFLGVLNVTYRSLLCLASALSVETPVLKGVSRIVDLLRWLLYMWTELMIGRDLPQYGDSVANPIITHYLSTMKWRAFVLCCSIALHEFTDSLWHGTEWAFGAAIFNASTALLVEALTQWFVIRARRDYDKRVSVDVVYTTRLE